MTRRLGMLSFVLSAWLSGLVLATRWLPFESPFALRHPAEAPLPGLEPPPEFCEPLFVAQGCYLREDLSPEQHHQLEVLLERRGQEVARWRAERRLALGAAAWWRGGWPRFAAAWTVLAALAWALLGRIAPSP